MSKAEKVSEDVIRVAQCQECPGARFVNRNAKKRGLKHAEDNPGHRVLVSFTYQGVYQAEEES